MKILSSFTSLKNTIGLWAASISSAFDARMLVHFRLWRLKRRKTGLWQSLQNMSSRH